MQRYKIPVFIHVAVPDNVSLKQATDYVNTTIEEVLLEVPFNLDGSLDKESIESKVTSEGMTIYDYTDK